MKFPIITRRQSLTATAILSLAATAFLVAKFDGTWLHPDTAQALSVARNVQQGNGFRTGVIYYEEHYLLNTWPAPQTVFPIGFPAMIAGLGALGIPLRLASLLIGVAGFMLVPLLICEAAQRMGRKPSTGLMLAAVSLGFPMIWHNVWERQTEMMFIALTLTSLILLQNSTLSTRRLLLAGLFAAIAFSLRYAGIFWLMAVGCVLLLEFSRKPRHVIAQGVTFCLIPAIVAISLFARNAMLVGDVKGGNNKAIDRSLMVAAESAYYGVSRLTGLDKENLLAGRAPDVAAMTGLALLFAAAIICLIRIRRLDFRNALALRTTGDSAVYLYIGVSLTALIGLEKTTSINLSPRMFFPLIPFVLLALADFISRMLKTIPENVDWAIWHRRLILSGAALLLFGVLSGQTRSATEIRNHVHRFGLVDEACNEITESLSGTIVPREMLAGKRILSDESHMLAEVLQQGTVGLTSTTYTMRIWTDKEVIALIRKYQIDRIVVFPDVQPKDENPFFESLVQDGLHHESSRDWLEPIVISPRIQIYAVRDSLLLTQSF